MPGHECVGRRPKRARAMGRIKLSRRADETRMAGTGRAARESPTEDRMFGRSRGVAEGGEEKGRVRFARGEGVARKGRGGEGKGS